MLKRIWPAAACLFVFVTSAWALTVDELIEKNIEARGGIENIRSLQSLRQTGKVRYGEDGSLEMGYTFLAKRPGMLRSEQAWQGMIAISAYDGDEGWKVRPFRGRRDPEKMSGDELKLWQVDADLEGILIDYKSKGHTVEYLGTEDVDGTEAHKLKVTLKNGDVRYIYLDPDYFLEIRYLDQTRVRGVEEEYETDLGNYEKINGVYLPFSLETGPKGEPKDQKITIDKVEANVELDDALFHFPAAGGNQ